MAVRDARTQEFNGWFWKDGLDAEKKMARLFLPNYFNTFCHRLRIEPLYPTLFGTVALCCG
jgi:hypothetical protein